MRKTVALIDADPKILKMCQETDAICQTFVERKKFLDKQQEDLLEEGQKTVGAYVDRIEAYLVEHGRMPSDFDKKKHHTHFDVEKNMVYICDGEGHAPASMADAIAKALGITR